MFILIKTLNHSVINRTTAIAVAALLILLAAWAPWMNDQAIHDRILKERGIIDGTIDKETGELICDYKVNWFPFGRYVASCEGGYFVTFYESVIF